MIVYKIDKQALQRINTRIREMDAVLKEIAPTLQILAETVAEQGETISSPTLNMYRTDLQHRLAAAVAETARLADDAQRLIVVSDQAAKHLSAIEEHFGTQLRPRSAAPIEQEQPRTNQLVS